MSKLTLVVVISVLALILLAAIPSSTDVRLPGLVSDGMVVQRGTPVRIQGWAGEGEKVTVRFNKQSASAVTKDGKWSVTFKPMKAGGPFSMTITGKNTIEIKNVLVGDVWVCSGQSNMEWTLGRLDAAADDVAKSANPNIRLFQTPRVSPERAADDVQSAWRTCGPETSAEFSAIGYYFGRALQRDLNVPIGLIDASWGGTIIEWWARASYYQASPELKKIIDGRSSGGRVANGPVQNGRIGGIYNGVIAPLTWYPIKGVIWYQGESNCRRPDNYAQLLAGLIRNWREDWGLGDFPFLAVQIAPFSATEYPANSWPKVREAQLLTSLNVPKVGLVVTTDVGDENNIHPLNKAPVAERLALAARAFAYGQKIEYSGPVYKSMKISGNRITLRFSHIGKGLMAKSGQLKGFQIAPEVGRFVSADAIIKGSTVVVSSASVPQPVAVRYGWAAYPVVDFWNKDGLPASPFRTNMLKWK